MIIYYLCIVINQSIPACSCIQLFSYRWIDDQSKHIKEHYTHEWYSPSMLFLNRSVTIPFITLTYVQQHRTSHSLSYILFNRFLQKPTLRPCTHHKICMIIVFILREKSMQYNDRDTSLSSNIFGISNFNLIFLHEH